MRTAASGRLVIAIAVVLGACSNDGGGVSRELGARCTATSQCDDRCLLPDAEYPGGFCTVACNTDSECPSDSTCVDREGGICLFDCATDADCTFLGTGWACKGG